ncbi:OmpA family protein [Chitinophaga oryzae]|uniref:OmpA family protein n=1 Tax=Chitinophaga oryzae TaxID=2725414 RepID=A0AAE6ZCK5_9BACT|nr:OmpA family protein [Chitinophaga oryzae]QJB30219.1 OmpA family protein [Chitinophaga oryzae]QJB36725.1 OmpA family protein [Chitinophaga oryzae]
MSFDLLESAKSIFNSSVVSQASSQLGESEGGIQKALSGIIPVVLTGLLNKAGSGGDAGGLLNMIKGVAGDANPSAVAGALQSGGGGLLAKGGDLLRSLFGDKISSITGMLSSFAGIKESSASTLLQTATPATLGAAGQYAAQNNLTPNSFLSFLNTQKDSILNAVPGGLNLAGVLGLSSLGDLGKKLGGIAAGIGGVGIGAANAAVNTVKQSGGGRWIWSLLLLLVAIILLWYLMKGCGGKNPEGTTVTDSITTSQLADSAATHVTNVEPMNSARESIQVTLPDGTVLQAYKGGIEDQLVTFLKDDTRPAGKDVWFDFDNLNFKTGSAVITEESMTQVKNIAAILKAFPKSKIKIGGYTDRTGDSTQNLRLSQERAAAVENALKNEKADMKQLLGAEGYGSQFAKAAATAPDEERKKDRHISVSVREK